MPVTFEQARMKNEWVVYEKRYFFRKIIFKKIFWPQNLFLKIKIFGQGHPAHAYKTWAGSDEKWMISSRKCSGHTPTTTHGIHWVWLMLSPLRYLYRSAKKLIWISKTNFYFTRRLEKPTDNLIGGLRRLSLNAKENYRFSDSLIFLSQPHKLSSAKKWRYLTRDFWGVQGGQKWWKFE